MKLLTQASLSLIASLVLWPASSTAQAQPKDDACEPIGRVLESSQKSLVGKLLCSGDQIISQIADSFVLCYFNPSEQRCRPKKQTQNPSIKECPFPSRSLCRRIKGGNRTGQIPRIITPYGRWLLESRPTFSWLSVPGATKYQLEVADQSKGIWSKTTTTTSLKYPEQEDPLVPENHYRVSVIAFKNNVPLVADTSIFRLRDSATNAALQKTIQLIQRLNLDPDQEAYLDLNAAYLKEGLLNRSIKVLQNRVLAGSDHPEVFRVLAERYIEAGLFEKARKHYLQAQALAKAQDNQIALKKATEGLQLLERYQSQLPDKKKGAQ